MPFPLSQTIGRSKKLPANFLRGVLIGITCAITCVAATADDGTAAPVIPMSATMPVGRGVFWPVGFSAGRADVPAQARPGLIRLAQWHTNAGMALCVEADGSDAIPPVSAASLAWARARAVVDVLIAAGADEKRLDFSRQQAPAAKSSEATVILLRRVEQFCPAEPGR